MVPAFDDSAIHAETSMFLNDPFAIARGMKAVKEPIPFRIASGSQMVDFVSTDDPPLKLMSTRLIHLLEKNQFSGWSTFPAILRDRANEEITGYSGVVVTGRCGPIHNERSHRVTRMPLPGGKHHEALIGVYFDEESWDGNDIFMPADYSYMIVTDAVRQAFLSFGISNTHFEQLGEIERSTLEID